MTLSSSPPPSTYSPWSGVSRLFCLAAHITTSRETLTGLLSADSGSVLSCLAGDGLECGSRLRRETRVTAAVFSPVRRGGGVTAGRAGPAGLPAAQLIQLISCLPACNVTHNSLLGTCPDLSITYYYYYVTRSVSDQSKYSQYFQRSFLFLVKALIKS